MIIFQHVVKYRLTNKLGSRQLFMTFPADISRRLGWQDQELTFIVFRNDEEVTAEKIQEMMVKQREFVEQEKAYLKMKEELLEN